MAALQICAASCTPITDPTLLPLKMLATKSPVVALFDAAAGNLPAYFAARWGVQTGGVSWLVADREFYGADRGVTDGGIIVETRLAVDGQPLPTPLRKSSFSLACEDCTMILPVFAGTGVAEHDGEPQ